MYMRKREMEAPAAAVWVLAVGVVFWDTIVIINSLLPIPLRKPISSEFQELPSMQSQCGLFAS